MNIYESWRHFLYYTLGLVPPLFFGLRFLIQWISSEKKKKSYVNKTFWYLSLCGNCLLAVHYFIQIQYLLMLIQVVGGFISWRNINLLSVDKKTFRWSLALLIVSMAVTTLVFFAQSIFLTLPMNILEIPAGLVKTADVSFVWHLFGSVGCLVFASRFWFQWIEAEKSGVSRLSKNFWLISIFGSVASLIYFFHIKDWVSCLNYGFGLIPYIRNLMIFKKTLKMAPQID